MDHLDSLKCSSAKISSAQFDPPGMFTNAIITKPEITTLIRDALALEQLLYKVPHTQSSNTRHGFLPSSDSPAPFATSHENIRPQRVDGHSTYIEPVYTSSGPAVKVPVIVSDPVAYSEELSSPSKRHLVSKYTLVPPRILDSTNVDEICDCMLELTAQFPPQYEGVSWQEHVKLLKAEYSSLTEEIVLLEKQYEQEKIQLQGHSESQALHHFNLDRQIEQQELENASLEREIELKNL